MRTRVRFETDNYVATYGHTPRGRGSWAFQIEGVPDIFWTPGSTTFAEARRLVQGRVQGILSGVVVVEVLT